MNWKLSATVAATAAALLCSCTSQGDQDPSPSPSTSVTTTTTAPTTSTPPSFRSSTYEIDPVCADKIGAITREFGLLVMQEAGKRGSAWGVFDTYCTTEDFAKDGWTSQGYRPQIGDECSTQHNPQYGGPDIQVIATYEVLPGGQHDFVRASISASPDCRVNIDHSIFNRVKSVSTTKIIAGKTSAEMRFESSSNATSLAEANAADEKVIACVKATRP